MPLLLDRELTIDEIYDAEEERAYAEQRNFLNGNFFTVDLSKPIQEYEIVLFDGMSREELLTLTLEILVQLNLKRDQLDAERGRRIELEKELEHLKSELANRQGG